MLYGYKDIPENVTDIEEWIEEKLIEARLHDPLVNTVYNLYAHENYKSKKFYMLLAYHALKLHNKMQNNCLKLIQRGINPPIILQYKDGCIPAELKDKLDRLDKLSWYQQLWNKIWR